MALPCMPAQTVDLHRAIRIDSGTPVLNNGPDGAWLGLTLFAPYFQPENWALHVPGIRQVHDLTTEVRHLLCDAFKGSFDSVAPIVPQRHSGMAMYVAYPQVLNHDCDSGVAVIFDLSRVGGGYFASVTSRVISHADLTRFIIPLATHGHDEFLFCVGDDPDPKGPGTHVVVLHGSVITALSLIQIPSRPIALEELFVDTTEWCSLQHLPRTMQTPCICAISGMERFVLRQDYHLRRTIEEAISLVADSIGAPCAMATSFAFSDLSVHGEHCDRIVGFSKLAPASAGRKDCWVFCDYRPLGRKPMVYLAHTSPVHIRTIVSTHSIQAPHGFRLRVQGGSIQGDCLVVEDTCTLVFTAVPDEAQASGGPPTGSSTAQACSSHDASISQTSSHEMRHRKRSRSEADTHVREGPNPDLQESARADIPSDSVRECKQPDLPGDTAHPAPAAEGGQLDRLNALLEVPPRERWSCYSRGCD